MVTDARAARARQSDEDFVEVMATAQGRRFVWRLLAHTDARNVVFSTNATQMAHNAALRDFAKSELRDRGMTLCPDAWLRMHRENDSE